MENNIELKIGDKLPDITLPSDEDKQINVKDYIGKNIVIYFYPKDDTSGCTTEAIDFSSAINEFKKLNTIIIGISRDPIKKHAKFKLKHELKHILLSDIEGEICEKFNCWVEKSMYGRKYMGVARKTFLVNTEGMIEKIWPKVKIAGHVEDVINSIKSNQQS